MAKDLDVRQHVAGQHAVAAFEAIAVYARERLRPWTADSGEGGRDPAQDHHRLSAMLCALRHLADKIPEISFRSVLADGNWEYDRQRAADRQPAIAASAAAAARAIDACHRSINAPGQYPGSAWPPDALTDLRDYAAQAGLGLPAAISRITGQLIAGLWHHADRQYIAIGTVMTTAHQAYARHRLAAEGPFQTGLEPGQQPATVLAPSPAAVSGLIATHQGIITSFAETEWLLVRTAARIDYQARHAPASSYEPDEDDLLTLSRALARMCGQSAGQVIIQLTPRIEARITEIEQGPETAAELGRSHGHAAIEPYCDLDIDGDATALMHALGETEPMTDANHPHRLNLVTAYARAYRQASIQGPATAASPARIAAQGFPRHPGPPATPAEQDPATRQARARPGSRPRHGPAR